MKIKFLHRYLIIICAAILAACASPNNIAVVDADSFSRIGRFAINYQSNLQKPYAAQGGFSWLDNGQNLSISLSNPMGSTLARIKINDDHAVFKYADGTTQSAETPDELLAMVWGHAIPVAGLRYWMHGEAYPQSNATDKRFNDNGELTSFVQLGWQVNLSNYDKLGPKKIRLLRADAQSRLNLQFIIN